MKYTRQFNAEPITWTEKTAEIRQGDAVIFKQENVRVPSTWSQLATNIVASKYFYGALDTPERESGVDQLVARVADTISDWGLEDGYFTNQSDRDAFCADLSHLLLHQCAAFNSPVWFNVGLAQKYGVTADPCNWYWDRRANRIKQPANPFEYPQVSACQPYNSLVVTELGLIPIGQIVNNNLVGLHVFDGNNWAYIKATKHNGKKEVFRVTLTDGRQLDVTSDHLIAACKDRRAVEQWLTLPQITNEYLKVSTAGGMFGKSDVTPSEAALVGWLQCDGYVGQPESATSLIIEFETVNQDELDWVVKHFETVFPGVSYNLIPEQTSDKTLTYTRLRAYGEQFRAFVEKFNLLVRNPNQTVPNLIYQASAEAVRHYLKSVFQCDGYVTVSKTAAHIGLSKCSFEMVRGVQSLLGLFGIYSRTIMKNDRRDNRHVQLCLDIANLSERVKFSKILPFIGQNKQQKLARSLTLPGKTTHSTCYKQIMSVESLGLQDVYDIQTSSGAYLSNFIRVHNCFIQHVDDSMDSIMDLARSEAMLFKFGSGSGSNLSTLRAACESLSGGGKPSGPISFMRVYDQIAEVVTSGGRTRRAALLKCLDVGHPDIAEFISCKMEEEAHANMLVGHGVTPSRAAKSVMYQNMNISVRVNDAFLRAVEMGDEWATHWVTNPERKGPTFSAPALWRKIAEGTWACGDPGLQYDTTINNWNTIPRTGRINASNPCCFTGDTEVLTNEGKFTFAQLAKKWGNKLKVFSYDLETNLPVLRSIKRVWRSGYARNLVKVTTTKGVVVTCTPEHIFYTRQGDELQAKYLRPGHRLKMIWSEFCQWVDENRDLTNDQIESVEFIRLSKSIPVYDMEVEGTHNFVVSSPGNLHGLVVHNSEFMAPDNTACNLASINLLKFYDDFTGEFNYVGFQKAVRILIIAQDILVDRASYPIKEIARNAHRCRQLGLGYTNFGALCMSMALPYDSDEARQLCSRITAIMTAQAYLTSSELAYELSPFEEWDNNADAMLKVLDQHADAAGKLGDKLAQELWEAVLVQGSSNGFRNSQVTLLAPTGCIDAGALVLTDKGLVRLASLGRVTGETWQPVKGINAVTPDGPQSIDKFYCNTLENVVTVTTKRGYSLVGTPAHQIKVFNNGELNWKRLGDIKADDLIPIKLGGMTGQPQTISLPDLPETLWPHEHDIKVPRVFTPELADFVGFFMGDGSYHARGLRLHHDKRNIDEINHYVQLGKTLFNITASIIPEDDSNACSVYFNSVQLALWWEACGFCKHKIDADYIPHIPDSLLATNSSDCYRAFLRGLFTADGNLNHGYAYLGSAYKTFIQEVQTLLLVLGFPTTIDCQTGWKVDTRYSDKPFWRVRTLNRRWFEKFQLLIGFNRDLTPTSVTAQSTRYDLIPVSIELIQRICPENNRLHKTALMAFRRQGCISRYLAEQLLNYKFDIELANLLGYFYDTVVETQLSEQLVPTFDLSVPSNVTYIANGFISHNTISFMMDCDTTGIEPDIALIKTKNLVGGGIFKLVNQSVEVGLRKLGLSDTAIEKTLDYLNKHETLVGNETLTADEQRVFATSLGKDVIDWQAHLKMMAAAQPFLSGAISKTVNMPATSTVEDIAGAYFMGWKLGLKSVALYRDGSKTAQPVNIKKDEILIEAAGIAAKHGKGFRERLPDTRQSITHKFTIGGHDGYFTVGLFPDGRPGELFISVAKEGSTLGGIFDCFGIAVSIALQYGVPLSEFIDKFSHVRFEPMGFTKCAEVRSAKSIVDYIFRWLAQRFAPDVSLPVTTEIEKHDTDLAPIGTLDAPICDNCGELCVRVGTCYLCYSCGSSGGCS